MRHKQRPIKSSRHKSVTCIIDNPRTSFGDNHESKHHQQTSTSYAQYLNNRHHNQPSSTYKSFPREQQPRESTVNLYARGDEQLFREDDDEVEINDDDYQHHHHQHDNDSHNRNRATVIATSEEAPIMRKQFEHNVRHMSDVMRLAFLENNDITPETWKNIDFNSLSTASILQRNIQQQLQQQRRSQIQVRYHPKPQQRNQQLQQQQHNQIHHQTNHYQNLPKYPRAEQNLLHVQEEDDDFVGNNLDDDDELSDSMIFATTTPSASQNSRRPQQDEGSGKIARNKGISPRTLINIASPTKDDSTHSLIEGFHLCDEPGCGKSFPSLRKLRHHKVVHSDDFPFVCEFRGCGKKFKRKFGIDLHSTTHFDLDPEMYTKTSNNSSLPFFGRRMQYSMCKPCRQKFKTVHEYQYHMLKHGKEPFKCPVKGCGQTFSIWKSFQKHRASHYFNYYCKMDPKCDHHTSNLQLLKLHIYCCHFRRTLPDNATLASKDPLEEEAPKDESNLVVDEGDSVDVQEAEFDIQEAIKIEDSPTKSTSSTPRRDSRLRKNPPRSSAFGQQDYASINNGSLNLKSTPTTPQSKRTRSTSKHQSQQEEFEQQQSQQSGYNEGFEDNEEDDFQMSDGTIFTTRTPTSSSSKHVVAGGTNSSSTSSTKRVARIRDISPRAASQTPRSIKEEGFLCDEPDCGKSFPSLRKLRHHKVVHSDDFPFVCEFRGCGKKFKRKFGIDLHSTTHFDLDPEMYSKTSNNSSLPFFGRRMQYSMCNPCGQKFKTVHEYQYHMLKHGKEPFKCPVKGCGQTFSIWKSFQKHRASHYFNYYCKMDPVCDHHTSNLQLLKLHIYCCHFRRKLPDNAKLASNDPLEDEPPKDEPSEVADDDDDGEESKVQENLLVEDPSVAVNDPQNQSQVSTPRRDSRLRKNPPRSSTFGHQDYASINNGSSFAKAIAATPQSLKRTRATVITSGSQSAPADKKPKLPLKVLPKRSAQRLPMSLIAADDGSTEDDGGHSSECGSAQNDNDDDGVYDPAKKNRFRCHLCDYKFSVRFQLTKHLSTHLELTPEMYEATADTKVIQLSEKRRREFYCDKCNITYEQMPDLDVHMRKHGQRPYVCNFCQVPSTFRLAKQYLSHLYEHRFNYKCSMAPNCEFTINRKDALKLHIFRMHLDQQLPSYIENFANMVDCNEWSEQ